jgi:hypothetical protein
MHVLGLTNEKYVMYTYIVYIQEQNYKKAKRETERKRDKWNEYIPPDHLGSYFSTLVGL